MATQSPFFYDFPDALVVYANYAQFTARQQVQFPAVQSRMALWCKAGRGLVTINGKACPLEAGRYLFLPWGHSICYEADADDPFFMGGVHLIPEYQRGQAVSFTVAHDVRHPLAQTPFRRDINMTELAGLQAGSLEAQSPLAHLLEYVVGVFLRGNPEEPMARQLAQQLLWELTLCRRSHEVDELGAPPELQRLKQYILSHLHQPLSLRDLVKFAGVSPATVGRMFRKHLHTTSVSWIMRMRMQRAQMLLRTRRLSVYQVGEQVGMPDPYYFSKCFKKHFGYSPRQYRRQTAWI